MRSVPVAVPDPGPVAPPGFAELAGNLLGWVKWKTGSLYPSILLHFLHNLIVLEVFCF